MDWIIAVEWSARVILVGLVGLSIWSVSIILDRRSFFQTWDSFLSMDELIAKVEKGEVPSLNEDDPRMMFLNKAKSFLLDKEKLDTFFIAFVNQSQKKWKDGLSVLGTLGSTTPFIGLLGTILGIIVSFGELSKGNVDMKGVMFSLAEALILTAVGLAVAIPAVIAFNYFNKKTSQMIKDIETIKELQKTFS